MCFQESTRRSGVDEINTALVLAQLEVDHSGLERISTCQKDMRGNVACDCGIGIGIGIGNCRNFLTIRTRDRLRLETSTSFEATDADDVIQHYLSPPWRATDFSCSTRAVTSRAIATEPSTSPS